MSCNHSTRRLLNVARLVTRYSTILSPWHSLQSPISPLYQVLVDTTKSAREAQGVYQQIPIPYKPGNLDIAEEREERVNMLKDFSYRYNTTTS